MSSPPSQKPAIDNSRTKRKDKPPALQSTWQTPSTSPDDRAGGEVADEDDPRQIRSGLDFSDVNAEPELPRSSSATSSLDPYYFGAGTPSESPIPSSSGAHLFLKTPEMQSTQHTQQEPVTPAKNPAAIDRRGLVGVGELATPRWTRDSRRTARGAGDVDEHLVDVEEESYNARDEESFVDAQEAPPDLPDSPWTIEAIDGEQDEEDFLDVQPPPRTLRTKRSNADESGGEEILYPRQAAPPVPSKYATAEQEEALDAVHPPTAYSGQRPRKRTSDEFELDQNGFLASKHTSSSSSSSKDKDKARKHRSLGVGLPSSSSSSPRDKNAKERRRDTLSLNVRHTRQISASSSSSSHDKDHASHHSRRLHASDYSHLPPSPGTSSIQQFLRHGSGGSTTASPMSNSNKELPSQVSANVAHSLLRGTQEGWSDLDDQATVEALRKLDGISGRSARARSSVGGHSRMGSASRPSTPAKSSVQWEGVEGQGQGRRSSRVLSTGSGTVPGKDRTSKDQGNTQRQSVGLGLGIAETSAEPEQIEGVSVAKDDIPLQGLPTPDKPLKKHGSVSKRGSFTPKRGSASSTNYTGTPTTGSRDSTSLSATTSATSPSGLSTKSHSKARRNSAGSDISSNHSSDAISLRDRAALAAATEVVEENFVPPVPPLPKVYSSLKPTQQTQQNNVGIAFPTTSDHAEEKPSSKRAETEPAPKASLDLPTVSTPPKRQSIKVTSPPSTSTNVHKTPSKKWSFTNPLGKKLVTSPSTSSIKDSNAKSPTAALSPRALSFTSQLRKSTSREHPMAPESKRKQSNDGWETINADAMASASSLASMSSLGSPQILGTPASAPLFPNSKTPERLVPSRSETASSASTNLTASMPPLPQHTPLSPSSSIRRGASTKRLTPSSIPFFRRSSSQSMQIPPANVPPSSPTYSSTHSQASQARSPSSGMSPTKESQHAIAVPSSSHKKSSVLMGLPSLLKGSSSRRSLHSDKEKSDAKSAKEEARHAREAEKERHKKEDKERSESRISVLMGRKRGKTLSSAQPKKQEPVAMPPMQITALPPATAQRLANLKSGSPSSLSSADRTPKGSASRVTGQTFSSMQKQSDASLRSSRNGLPTIAGSPSVGTLAHQGSREPPSSASLNASTLSKETPTKIPRITGRSSAANSPTLKGKESNRRASLIINNVNTSRQNSPSANDSLNEFGVLENGQTPKAASTHRHSVRASPSVSTSTSRVPRQVPVASSSTSNSASTRKNRESLSFSGLRKSSTGSVASINASSGAHEDQPSSHGHRFSALSPSKLKLLSPKISLPSSRGSTSSQSIAQTMASPSLNRQTTLTPSPVSSVVDDEELIGDEEMMQYIKRQQAKKLAAGASQAELDELLRFPEPIRPASPASPASILKSSQVQYLSEYERKEILEYQSVYYIGARSDKKPATLENTTNNHGYDDERGDYLVVMHDHLAFRYEIIDTLGKGSFGQVLHCRDHCTGESIAIKIIRNKKRFHHQALVEIKILDNLRKWDADEKHHVIKMTEHFYFRGHLCIATELLSINLYELIKANNFVGFTTALIRRFTSQMLQSLALMRHHRVVHCDLKPENVLLRHPAKSAIKVIDFGSSCFEHEKIYTYIQSRFYRSPEVILGMNYHMAIDMWSLGCIMAELYTGFPIFPGENEQEQLSCIMEVLGVPEKEFINRSSRKRLFFDTSGAPRPVVNSKGRRRRPGSKSLAQVLKCDDEQFVDFIAKCLVWDPERRLKPASALRHPYITAGKRPKIASPPPPSSSRSMLSSSTSFTSNRTSKNLTETPKKSLISAPTPLTARSSRVTSGVGPTTPSTSGAGHSTLGSSRSYRTAQSQSFTYHSSHSSRTMLAK